MTEQNGEKHKGGAPRKPEGKKRTKKVMLNLTSDEKELFQATADEMGLTLTGFFLRAARLLVKDERGGRGKGTAHEMIAFHRQCGKHG